MSEWFTNISSLSLSQTVSIALVLFGAASSAAAKSNRRAVMGLWAGQLGAGSLLLAAGAELLAVLMWVSATLAAAVYFLHADLFSEVEPETKDAISKSLATAAFPAMVSVGFGAVVWLLFDRSMEAGAVGSTVKAAQFKGSSWNDERLVALELTTLFALAATVGAGVISRARRSKS